jgi:hypothetical protein
MASRSNGTVSPRSICAISGNKLAVGGRGKAVEGVGRQLAAGHEVGELFERNARGVANLFVGLPHGLYRPPQSAADGVFRGRPLAGLATFKQPRKLGPHGSLDLGIVHRLGGGHSGTSHAARRLQAFHRLITISPQIAPRVSEQLARAACSSSRISFLAIVIAFRSPFAIGSPR